MSSKPGPQQDDGSASTVFLTGADAQHSRSSYNESQEHQVLAPITLPALLQP
jgi:hypothetical protein